MATFAVRLGYVAQLHRGFCTIVLHFFSFYFPILNNKEGVILNSLEIIHGLLKD